MLLLQIVYLSHGLLLCLLQDQLSSSFKIYFNILFEY
ncbi:hypothetical protein GLYMA_20G041366v4 [Glycine max]|nr:hypothetical protein GLYMA_20G041366v4 [Glycine max]KAH1034460.1 hypothetical protein GYH30_054747 [Glycine max]